MYAFACKRKTISVVMLPHNERKSALIHSKLWLHIHFNYIYLFITSHNVYHSSSFESLFLLPWSARTSVHLAKMNVFRTNLPNKIAAQKKQTLGAHTLRPCFSPSISIAWHVQTINIVWLMRMWEWDAGCGMRDATWKMKQTYCKNAQQKRLQQKVEL